MIADRDRQSLLTIFGISAGVATGLAAGAWLWRRRGGVTQKPIQTWHEPRGSAQDVAESLQGDGTLSRRRIEVDAIAEGVVELSGSVRDREESDRAVGIAQRTTGVYTVVNRLRIEAEDSHRAANRRRWTEGAPDLRERQHYGIGVGMGRSRHSPETDPDRPSDKQKIVERELDVKRMGDAAEPDPGAELPSSPEEAVPDGTEDAQPRE